MNIIEAVMSINDRINSVVWGAPMLILILITGVYLSIRTGFFQIRKTKLIAKNTIGSIFKKGSSKKSKDKKSMSQFQAMCTALAATLGTGNIAGVATAIAVGGPGAVFWMWVSAFFGMMTSYGENVLGIFYRKKDKNGNWRGGPMYYLENGLKEKRGLRHFAKPLAVLFAFSCVLASFGIGNMSQVNSISTSMEDSFGLSPVITGLAVAAIVTFVVIGGVGRIGKVTERLVPFMAVTYTAGALFIFLSNSYQIPYVFNSIFQSAFSVESIGGGIGGTVVQQAISMGFKRGVFSNEAGLGSAVIVHCASDVKEPAVQGMWGIFEVFVDTIVMCTLTAFVLLSSIIGNTVSLDDALSNVSLKPQYVALSASDNLISSNANEVPLGASYESNENSVPVKTIYGQDFYIPLAKTAEKSADDFIFTNVVTVEGVQAEDENGELVVNGDNQPVLSGVKIQRVNGVPLVSYAFSQTFGSIAGKVLAIAILFFAFSTILGWSFYGAQACSYLFGPKSVNIYKVIFIAMIVLGANLSLEYVWNISDTFNGLMALPNLIGVLALSGTVFKVSKNYLDRQRGKRIKPLVSKYED